MSVGYRRLSAPVSLQLLDFISGGSALPILEPNPLNGAA